MQPPPGVKKNSSAPLVVGTVLVLIIGVVVYFMYFKKDDSPSPTPTDDSGSGSGSGSGSSGGSSDNSGTAAKPKPKLNFSKLVKIGGSGVAYIDCDDTNLYGSNNNNVYQMTIPACS